MNSRNGDYRAQIRRAKPPWYVASEWTALKKKAQQLTRLTGKPYQIDHIVPIANPIVCGLHCKANWQIVPGEWNYAKSNHAWPDMPGEQLHLFHKEDKQMTLPLIKAGV